MYSTQCKIHSVQYTVYSTQCRVLSVTCSDLSDCGSALIPTPLLVFLLFTGVAAAVWGGGVVLVVVVRLDIVLVVADVVWKVVRMKAMMMVVVVVFFFWYLVYKDTHCFRIWDDSNNGCDMSHVECDMSQDILEQYPVSHTPEAAAAAASPCRLKIDWYLSSWERSDMFST